MRAYQADLYVPNQYDLPDSWCNDKTFEPKS